MLEMSAAIPMRTSLRGRSSLTGAQKLMLYGSVAGAIGAAIWLGPLRDVTRLNAAVSIPWWAELIACYAASLFHVHVRVSRFGSQLSLTEIPIAMGLFLVNPHVLLACYAGGVLAAHWTRRGFDPVKDYTNVMIDVAFVAVTVLVFTAIGPDPHDPLAGRSILALAVAMFSGSCVFAPLAAIVSTYLEHAALRRNDLVRSLLFQTGATATNTCMGIVGLLFMIDRPLLAFALLPPVGLVALGQLAAGESQRRADRMEFLYRTTELLHSSRHVDEQAGELLAVMAGMFGVSRTELVLMPEARGPALRFVSTRNAQAEVASAELTYAEQETLNLLRADRMLSVAASNGTSPVSLLLAERGAGFGTVISLRGRERPQGMLLLLDPLQGHMRPTVQERNLLLTVAGQISVALENGQLAGAIQAMTAEKDELERRALYDPLTKIANRSLFVETVGKALSKLAASRRPLAVLFIDIDGFKEVNDTYGHACGDQVLGAVAARLRAEIRKMDMVARLGGDEFGILLGGLRSADDAHVAAQRIVHTLRRPMRSGDRLVHVGGSVGVALVDDPLNIPTAEEMLRRADMAMYLAKRQGKDRYVVFDPSARETVIAAPSEQPDAARA
jgi:diguanylate cyclase (GGDEF)-like protein